MPGDNSTLARLLMAKQKAIQGYIDLSNDDNPNAANLTSLHNAILDISKVLVIVKRDGGGIL